MSHPRVVLILIPLLIFSTQGAFFSRYSPRQKLRCCCYIPTKCRTAACCALSLSLSLFSALSLAVSPYVSLPLFLLIPRPFIPGTALDFLGPGTKVTPSSPPRSISAHGIHTSGSTIYSSYKHNPPLRITYFFFFTTPTLLNISAGALPDLNLCRKCRGDLQRKWKCLLTLRHMLPRNPTCTS